MEVLVTCDSALENKTSVTLWDPNSGTKMLTLRGPPAHQATLAFIKDEGMAIVESGKPFIHFWQCGHSLQTSRRILCPGKPCAMAMSPDGCYLAVAIDEKINIWQVATGRITNVLNTAHYRPVTVLKFSDDGSYVVSASQDGMVLAWKFITLVSSTSSAPLYSWSDHSFPVSDVHIGSGGSKATVFSVSTDRTMKIYSLGTGTLLMSVSFPLPLTAVVTDAAETAAYVGSTSGTIYQIKLNSPPRSIDHHISTDMSADYVFKKHTEKITGLTISADGIKLASSDDTGVIYLWDLLSNQAVKTINCGSSNSNTTVTNIAFWLGDPENLKGNKRSTILFPEVPKLVEVNEEERDEKDITVNVLNKFEQLDEYQTTGQENINRSERGLTEISHLKAQLVNCESINKQLHQFCVDNILGQSLPSEESTRSKRKKINT